MEYSDYGRAAIQAGSPDYVMNELRENAVDTIANVLHAVSEDAPDLDIIGILATAEDHFWVEKLETET